LTPEKYFRAARLNHPPAAKVGGSLLEVILSLQKFRTNSSTIFAVMSKIRPAMVRIPLKYSCIRIWIPRYDCQSLVVSCKSHPCSAPNNLVRIHRRLFSYHAAPTDKQRKAKTSPSAEVRTRAV